MEDRGSNNFFGKSVVIYKNLNSVDSEQSGRQLISDPSHSDLLRHKLFWRWEKDTGFYE